MFEPMLTKIFRALLFLGASSLFFVSTSVAQNEQSDDPIYFYSQPLEINASIGFFRIPHDIRVESTKQVGFIPQLKWILHASGLFNPDAPTPSYHLDLKDTLFAGLKASFTTTGGNLVFEDLIPLKKDPAEQEKELIAFVEKAFLAFEPKQKSIFQNAVLFVERKEDDNTRIMLTDFLGKNRWTMVDNNKINLLPSWSKDGSKFLYTEIDLDGSKVKLYDFKTRQTETLQIEGAATGGSFTDDPNLIILTQSLGGLSNVIAYNLKTGEIQKLTRSLLISTGADIHRKKLLYVGTKNVGIQVFIRDDYRADDKVYQDWRMTFQGLYNSEPKWNNSGNMFAFTSRLQRLFQIHLMTEDGVKTKALTKGPADHFQASFSSDDRQVLYTRSFEGKESLVFSLIDGSFQRELLPNYPRAISGGSVNGNFDWRMVR